MDNTGNEMNKTGIRNLPAKWPGHKWFLPKACFQNGETDPGGKSGGRHVLFRSLLDSEVALDAARRIDLPQREKRAEDLMAQWPGVVVRPKTDTTPDF